MHRKDLCEGYEAPRADINIPTNEIGKEGIQLLLRVIVGQPV